MYCRNCGSEMNENAVVCIKCGVPKGAGTDYCWNCGSKTEPNAAVCLNCGVSLEKKVTGKSGIGVVGEKSKIVAVLLAVFLGHLGVHMFYLGYKSKGIKNIIASIVAGILCLGFIGIPVFIGLWIFHLVEAYKIYTDKILDSDGNKLK